MSKEGHFVSHWNTTFKTGWILFWFGRGGSCFWFLDIISLMKINVYFPMFWKQKHRRLWLDKESHLGRSVLFVAKMCCLHKNSAWEKLCINGLHKCELNRELRGRHELCGDYSGVGYHKRTCYYSPIFLRDRATVAERAGLLPKHLFSFFLINRNWIFH